MDGKIELLIAYLPKVTKKLNKEALVTFGENVRKYRLKRKMNQEDLAVKADLGRNQISLIENGLLNPTLNTIIKIARSLEVQVKDLIDL